MIYFSYFDGIAIKRMKLSRPTQLKSLQGPKRLRFDLLCGFIMFFESVYIGTVAITDMVGYE